MARQKKQEKAIIEAAAVELPKNIKIRTVKDACLICTHKAHGNEAAAESDFGIMKSAVLVQKMRAQYPKLSERVVANWNLTRVFSQNEAGQIESKRQWECRSCGKIVNAVRQ